jgi:surface antigen
MLKISLFSHCIAAVVRLSGFHYSKGNSTQSQTGQCDALHRAALAGRFIQPKTNHQEQGVKGKISHVITLSTAVALGGCAAQGPQEESGMVIGGILGGVLGAQAHGPGRSAAIIIGTMAGAAIGGSIGRYMDDTDRLRAAQTLETVRTGVSTAWQNPDTGVEYQFTPTRTYTTAEGPCREYTMEALIGGKKQEV